jgi:hypothetical protein
MSNRKRTRMSRADLELLHEDWQRAEAIERLAAGEDAEALLPVLAQPRVLPAARFTIPRRMRRQRPRRSHR